MPFPALLGLPALMTFIGASFSALVVWFVERLTYRVVVFTLGMAAVLAALTSLYSAFSGYISDLALAMPPELQTMAMILPSNVGTCLTICLSANITALTYRFAMYIIRTKMDIVS